MSSKPSGRSTVAAEHSVPRREIPYVNLAAQYAEEREALLPIIDGVMRSGNYIGGEAVERLEAELAAFVGVEHAVALNSGTDALVLGLAALGIGPGDEAITPPNSFVASTAVIVHLRAKPVFVDVLPDQNIDPGRIEAAITPRTKAICVHLTGRMARMDEIKRIAKHGLAVIEDAAQTIGSKYAGRMSGARATWLFLDTPVEEPQCLRRGSSPPTTRRPRPPGDRNHGLVDRYRHPLRLCFRMDALQAAICTSGWAGSTSRPAAGKRAIRCPSQPAGGVRPRSMSKNLTLTTPMSFSAIGGTSCSATSPAAESAPPSTIRCRFTCNRRQAISVTKRATCP